jgi:hypothetical protein
MPNQENLENSLVVSISRMVLILTVGSGVNAADGTVVPQKARLASSVPKELGERSGALVFKSGV